ncbi:PA [Jos virus]|uniref:PA n=1 Tax=Jos virus TaxID=1027466 RepID=H6SW57_9ORTO|nr:PA [Jos virus]AED98376.1 PA [Jos virus]
MEKPDCVDSQIWELSQSAQDWHLMDYGFERRVIASIEYTLCCLMSNKHFHEGEPQYEVYKWLDRPTVEWLMKKHSLARTVENTPHIFDRKTNTPYLIQITEDIDACEPSDGLDWCIFFELNGETHPSTINLLLGSQLQDMKSYMTTAYEWIIRQGLLERMLEAISSSPKLEFSVPTKAESLLLSDTDWPLIPNTEGGEIAKIEGRRWTQMKILPQIHYEDPEEKAPWTALLLGADSTYIEFPLGTDQEVLALYHGCFKNAEPIRTSRSCMADLYRCVKESIQAASEGHFVRDRIPEDERAFGINYKRKYKNRAEATSSEHQWERATFPIEKKGLPAWVEEELDALYQECQGDWLDLEPNAIYTPVDEIAERLTDKFISLVSTLKVSSIIEKWQVACTRIFSQLHTDRQRISLCPIITRDKKSGVSQMWGVVLLGPHHVKRDTDNAPLLVFEFLNSCPEAKYPKHTLFVVTLELPGKTVQKLATLRVTSCSRNKLFTFSTIRRIFIQPSSMFSQVLLQRAADANQVDEECNPEISLYIGGALRAMTTFQWVRKILCMEFLMAIYNNSQMEGFLANIRRLHMSRHAMMERHQVFIPFGSNPAGKVEECVINNPIVLYLAASWNSLPNVYY